MTSISISNRMATCCDTRLYSSISEGMADVVMLLSLAMSVWVVLLLSLLSLLVLSTPLPLLLSLKD